MNANDLQRAYPFVQEADHLAPNDPSILEIKGHFLTSAHAFGLAIAAWERILRGNHPLSPSARLDYATATYESGLLTAAAEQLRLLHKEVPAGLPAASLLDAKLAERGGDQEAATAAALEVLAFAQSTGTQRYDAAVGLLANSRELPPRARAWKVLNQLAEGKDAVALQALAFMSSQQMNPTVNTEGREGLAADVPALIQRLEQHPLANPAIRLSVLELRFKQNPSQADALVAQAIADYKDGDDNALGTLCRWLLSHRGSAQAIELLPLKRVIKSRPLLTLRMEALAAAGEWGLVEKDLGDPAVSGQLDDVMTPLYLARSAARLGKAVAAEVNWDRAMALAAGDKRKLSVVGAVAESEHQSDRAQAAYEAAVAAAPGEMQGYVTLLRFSAEHGGAAASYKVLTAMTKTLAGRPSDSQFADLRRTALRRGAAGESSGNDGAAGARASQRIGLPRGARPGLAAPG